MWNKARGNGDELTIKVYHAVETGTKGQNMWKVQHETTDNSDMTKN